MPDRRLRRPAGEMDLTFALSIKIMAIYHYAEHSGPQILYREGLMNDIRRYDCFKAVSGLRPALWLMMFAALMLTAACGGESLPTAQESLYPAGSVGNQEIEQRLKFDARVESHEFDGNKLVVEVNQAWIQAPPGMQARAAGDWYNMWQSARKGEDSQAQGIEVEVKYQGDTVGKWTGEHGYQPVERMKEKADESGS